MNRGIRSCCSAEIVGLVGRNNNCPVGLLGKARCFIFRAQSASTLNGRMKYSITHHQVITSDMGGGCQPLFFEKTIFSKGLKLSVAGHSYLVENINMSIECPWFLTLPWQPQISCRFWHNSIFFSCFLDQIANCTLDKYPGLILHIFSLLLDLLRK